MMEKESQIYTQSWAIPNSDFRDPINPQRFYMDMGLDMEIQMEMEMAQIIEQIQEMKGEEGMEVFFNMEGLDKYIAHTIFEISQKPGENYYLVMMGGTGAGKEALGTGVIKVFNRVLAPLLREKNSDLKQYYMSNSGALKNAQEVGKMPKNKWVTEVPPEDLPKYTQAATDQMIDTADWAQKKQVNNKSATIVTTYEVLGITDAKPKDPQDHSFPGASKEKRMPIKLNMGAGLVQHLAENTPENLYVVAVLSDLNVIMRAAVIRTFIEEEYRAHKAGNYSDEDFKFFLSRLEEFGMKIDIKIDDPNKVMEYIYRSNGGAKVAEMVYNAIDQIIIRFYPEILQRFPEIKRNFPELTKRKKLTHLFLEQNPKLRYELEKDYIMILLEDWGIKVKDNNVFAKVNEDLERRKEESEKEEKGRKRKKRKTVSHDIREIRKHSFPRPSEREKDMEEWKAKKGKQKDSLTKKQEGLSGEFILGS